MDVLMGFVALALFPAAGAVLLWKGKRLKALAALVALFTTFLFLDHHRTNTDPEYAAAKGARRWKAEVTPAPVLATPALAEGVEIPRSVSGDKGRYYLLESKRDGDIIKTLHRRVGVDSIGWTRCEVNCKTMQMREIGYSEEGPKGIKSDPTKWFALVAGSSKSDMARFVCSQ